MATSPAVQRRCDVTLPATRDTLQRLLDHPEVLEVLLEKPLSPHDPVGVGIRRRSTKKCSFWYGASLFSAAALAEDALQPRQTHLEDA